tara:strand:+ start:445 stop:822 length:378 start_codon:yes stop_codon:yes gene_type:complete
MTNIYYINQIKENIMDNMLEYKGYFGAFHFDEQSSLFKGYVKYIQTPIEFKSETVSDLKHAFEQAIDDYLAHCETKGIEPESSISGKLMVDIGRELHEKVIEVSRAKGVSVDVFLKKLLAHELML